MCNDCGCGRPDELDHDHHDHEHGAHEHGPHTHTHAHTREHDRTEETAALARTLTIERNVLARNDELARENRDWLAERGVVALNLISAPGTGKTLLLERTLEYMRERIPCAVIAGDQQTDNDARRLDGKGAKVVQIETHSTCHLDAARVHKVLPEVVTGGTKLLFIENVGNLVCPAAFDLGESFKVALLATTEGEDKPVKYPALFSNAQAVIVNKIDLVPHLEWDGGACRRSIQRVHPGVFVFELSARTGEGLQLWFDYLENLVG